MYYKEAVLCILFAMAEADGNVSAEEMSEILTMKEAFNGYSEHNIVALFDEYRQRFSDKSFTEISNVMVSQIPEELFMGTLSIMADIAVVDFDVNLKEGSLISIVANAMGITDVAVKTLLLASLSKKLMLTASQQ